MRIAIVIIAASAMASSMYHTQYDGDMTGLIIMWAVALVVAIIQDINELMK